MGRISSTAAGFSASSLGQNSHSDAEWAMSLQTTPALGWWVYGSHLCAPFSFSAEGVFGRKGSLCAWGCSTLEHPEGLELRSKWWELDPSVVPHAHARACSPARFWP